MAHQFLSEADEPPHLASACNERSRNHTRRSSPEPCPRRERLQCSTHVGNTRGIYAPRYRGRIPLLQPWPKRGTALWFADSSTRHRSPQPIDQGVENRGARAAQVGMARSKMLAPMYDRGSLVSDARPDSVGAFDLLRPDSAQPDPPIFESSCQRFI